MSLSLSSNFLQRVLYSVLFTFILTGVLWTTQSPFLHWILIPFIYFIQLLAMRELYQLLGNGQNDLGSSVKKLSYGASALLYLFHGFTTIPLSSLILPYLFLLLCFAMLIRFKSIENATQEVMSIIFAALFITIPLLFSIDLAFYTSVPTFFSSAIHENVSPPFWLLIALFIAKGSDMAAYFTGKTIGKRLLAPQLSPKKTVEGAIGGSIGGLIGFWIIYLFQLPYPGLISTFLFSLMALFLSSISQISDLAESLIKRDLNVKDSSTYLPGLGGILDIVDSLLFTLPALFCILYLLS